MLWSACTGSAASPHPITCLTKISRGGLIRWCPTLTRPPWSFKGHLAWYIRCGSVCLRGRNAITTVFSHAQAVVLYAPCGSVLCQPTGGKARLTEGTLVNIGTLSHADASVVT
ncbi:hypothetical protein BD310DRAFT_818911 [Dichomitus squalens]|uniref:Uncharacterized protein n=1 Tax=Dichomitus squalens TaxID=114155 RepID=A0A4Q9PVY0_9APHY|nr:hypothetical protein BD310DRAFT_818911 [Dichomitus squalens]